MKAALALIAGYPGDIAEADRAALVELIHDAAARYERSTAQALLDLASFGCRVLSGQSDEGPVETIGDVADRLPEQIPPAGGARRTRPTGRRTGQ